MGAKQDDVVWGGETIFKAMIRRAGCLPESLTEVKVMASAGYGLHLKPVYDDPRLEAGLHLDRRGRGSIIYNAAALPSLQMLWIWHEVAEFAAIEDNPSLFDNQGYAHRFDGGWDPGDLRHRIAIETERHFMTELRRRGYSTKIMELRHRRPKPAQTFQCPAGAIEEASWMPPVAAPVPLPAVQPASPSACRLPHRSGYCHCGCANTPREYLRWQEKCFG